MEDERLDFARGARVLAAGQEVGLLTHVVADPDTRDVLEVVVARDGQEWLVPLAAVAAASRGVVELRRAWSALPTQPFQADHFDRVGHFAVHRRLGGDRSDRAGWPAEPPSPRSVPPRAGELEPRRATVGGREVVEVPVVREELVVERRTVPARPADGPIGAPRRLTVPLRAERVRLETVPVARGEVAVARRRVEDTQALPGVVGQDERGVPPRDPAIERARGVRA